MISHIVLFQPKPELTREDALAFAQQLKVTMSEIPSVHRAMVGRRLAAESGDSRNFGDTTYEYAAVIEFEDRSGLFDYLKNPLHLELGRLFWLHCARTVVLEVAAVDAKTDAVVELLVEQ